MPAEYKFTDEVNKSFDRAAKYVDADPKLLALRSFQRARNLGQPEDDGILRKAGLTEAAAARLYRLFTIAGYDERNVIPAQQREEQDPYTRKGASGFGILSKAGRGK